MISSTYLSSACSRGVSNKWIGEGGRGKLPHNFLKLEGGIAPPGTIVQFFINNFRIVKVSQNALESTSEHLVKSHNIF